MNILVTGGAGFIGSNLVHYLLGEEPGSNVTKVVNLDKLTYAGNPANLKAVANDDRYLFVQGDICDGELVSKLLTEHDIDAVMHLAAESHVDRSIDSPGEFIETNFVGTFQLLNAALTYSKSKHGFRFLHVSTDEVYGSLGADDPAFSETTAYAPNSPYSASKAGSDHLARAYFHTYGLDVVTTNCSNNYGPYQFPEKLIPLMIQKVLRGDSLPIYGDGSNVRDWLYVMDHCRGLFAALTQGRAGEVYNIGGRCELKNIDVVKELIRLVEDTKPETERRGEDLISFVTDRPGHDHRYAIDCSKISNELGWEPKESFNSGLGKTIQWYLENGEWIKEIESGRYRLERLGQG